MFVQDGRYLVVTQDMLDEWGEGENGLISVGSREEWMSQSRPLEELAEDMEARQWVGVASAERPAEADARESPGLGWHLFLLLGDATVFRAAETISKAGGEAFPALVHTVLVRDRRYWIAPNAYGWRLYPSPDGGAWPAPVPWEEASKYPGELPDDLAARGWLAPQEATLEAGPRVAPTSHHFVLVGDATCQDATAVLAELGHNVETRMWTLVGCRRRVKPTDTPVHFR